MKSITSKISIITLTLAAMAFTFVLGTTSSKAVGDDNSFQQCIAQVNPNVASGSQPGDSGLDDGWVATNTTGVESNTYAIKQIISCANQQ
jgi:hypothetical protein